MEVIANPHFPRLSAFEVVMEDGTVLWSKLNQPDGRNNLPHVFPKNEVLEQRLRDKLGMVKSKGEGTEEKEKIYQDFHTRVGVWQHKRFRTTIE